MNNSDGMQDGSNTEEETYLMKTKRKESWTNMDMLLLVFAVLVYMGDGCETYLPGVITQLISCEMELSKWQEGTLDCVMYFTSAVSTVISGSLANRFGGRELLLFSLYLSTFSAVVSALVGNYITLLLARSLIGVCIGLNLTTVWVMIAGLASGKDIIEFIVIVSSVMLTIGGVWSAVLGYLLLDVVGWRIFILLTSLPIFIPTIFMLHFCFVGTRGAQTQDEQTQDVDDGDPTRTLDETVTVPNFVARTTKLGLFGAVGIFQGWLTILLVPALIQMLKLKYTDPNSNCLVTVTQGVELLLVGIVTFAAIPGKLFMHFVRKRISFRPSQAILAGLNMGVFALMLLKESLAVIVLTNFLIKFLYGIGHQAYCYIYADIWYFGTERFSLGSSVSLAMGLAGGVVGMVMASFAPITYVLITAMALSVVRIVVVFFMTEVQL